MNNNDVKFVMIHSRRGSVFSANYPLQCVTKQIETQLEKFYNLINNPDIGLSFEFIDLFTR